MTTLGIVGAGHIGSTVARLAVDAGVDVVIANSRGPETLADLVADLGSRAHAATAEEAASAGDLVVLTVPLKALGDLPVAAFEGRVVLDTGNYYPQRDGRIADLDDGSATASELTARTLPGARVVKVFNNILLRAPRRARPPAGVGRQRRAQRPRHRRRRHLGQAGRDRAARHDRLRRGRRRTAWPRAGASSPTPRRTASPTTAARTARGAGATAKRVGAEELRAALAAATRD